MDLGPAAYPVCDTALPILESAPVGRRYHRLVLHAPGLAARSRPGQFFHLLCADQPGGGLPFLRRPMSIWRMEQDRLGFLFNVTGRGTAALATRLVGETLSVVGPLGAGFHLDPAWQRILILARGVGLATLAPLAATAAALGIASRPCCPPARPRT